MTFHITECVTVVQALDRMRFLLYGLKELRQNSKAREEIEDAAFVTRVMGAIHNKTGYIILLHEVSGHPVGFAFLEDCSEYFRDSSMILVALFVKDKYPNAMSFLFERVLQKCKDCKKTKLRAYTRRINGSAMKFYEDKLGFRREYVLFQRDVQSPNGQHSE